MSQSVSQQGDTDLVSSGQRGPYSLLAAAQLALPAGRDDEGRAGEAHVHADLGLADGELLRRELLRGVLPGRTTG